MSVYAINQRPTDQANATAAGKQQPQAANAAIAFAEALQSSLRFSPLGALPSVGSALQTHFDRPVDPPQPQAQPAASAPTRPVAAAPRRSATSSASATTQASKSDDSAPSDDTPAATQADGPQANQQGPASQTARPDTSDRSGGDSEASQQDPAQQASAPQVAPEAVAQQGMLAAAMAMVPQQNVAQSAVTAADGQAGAGAVNQDAGANAGQDPFAWLDKDHGDLIAKLANQITSGPAAAADGSTPALDPTQVAAAAPAKAAKGMTLVGQTAPAGVAQQAQDMASMLAGTGANLAVQVTTTSGPQGGAQNASAAETAVIDPAAAIQAAAAGAGGQGNTQGGASGSDGSLLNDAGAAAGQPQTATPSSATAAAPDVASFAAALAAQADTAVPAVEQQAPNVQMPQGVVPLVAAGGTQAAQNAAPAQAPQAPAPVRSPLPSQVADQVSVEINKQLKDGSDTIKINLKPVELGRIEIKLEVKHDGTVAATVTADNKDTLAMLQKDSSGLTKALSDAGLKADPGALSFNLRGDLQQQQQQAGSGTSGRGGRGRRQASGIDASSDVAASASPVRGGFGRSGVDIRV